MNSVLPIAPATAHVYLVRTQQYTPGEACCDDLKELREHWIVDVDIDQKSSESNIVGLELHLLRKSPESNTILGTH